MQALYDILISELMYDILFFASDIIRRIPVMVDNFGFIHENADIKVLILFIMRRLPEPVTLDVLTDLTMCDDGIGYFNVTECITMLIETDHIKTENNKYSLTAKGERNGEILEKNLPYSVRIKAENSTAGKRAMINRNAMIKTQCNPCEEGGYKLSLSLSDGIGEIISMELFAANEQRANKLEHGFRENAEKVYQAIIDMLLSRDCGINENLDGN